MKENNFLKFLKRKIILGLVLLCTCGFMLQAQEIKGRITSDDGEPLPGVSVQVEGTSKGTVSDIDGNYSIQNPGEGSVLVFSYVGFKPTKVTIGNQSTINVSLLSDLKILDEVVVVGYGTAKKRDISGAITSISSNDIEERQAVTIYDAMQGEAAGVLIVSQSGAPGAGTDIQIRGASTFEGGINPLYIVDGAPTDDISSINPNDIESLEILKDAASAAIYGSRSANGVIIITTKKGNEGKPKVDVRYLHTWSQLSHKIPQASRKEWQIWQNRSNLYYNDPTDSLNVGTNADNDYQELLFRTAGRDQLDFSVSGGSKSTRIFASLSFLNQQGIIINSEFKRLTGRVNIDYDVSKKLTVGNRLSFGYTTGNYVNEDGVLNTAMRRPATWWVYFPDGSLAVPFGGKRNPIADALKRTDDKKQYSASLFDYAEYKFFDGLKLTVNVSASGNLTRKKTFYPLIISTANPATNSGTDETDFNYSLLNSNYLSFNKTFASDHTVNALVGSEIQTWKSEAMDYEGDNYVSEEIMSFNAVQDLDLRNTNTSSTAHSMVSFFGKAGYSYKGRYIFNSTLRYDGSSRFQKSNRWGAFPSVSVAWRFSDEPFMQWSKKILSDGKFRASWGVTGNESIGNYESQLTYTFGNNYYNGVSGVVQNSSLGNPDIRWEKTSQTNFGVDLALLNSRINFTADYYNKITSDLLYSAPLPAQAGYSNVKVNLGSIENKGFEFAVNAYPVRNKNFKWNTIFNISFNENRVKELYNNTTQYPSGGNYILEEGGKVGNFYGWNSLGVYQYDESNAYDPQTWERLIPVLATDDDGNVILDKGGHPTVLKYTYQDGTDFTGTFKRLSINGNIAKGGDYIWENASQDSIIDDKDRVILGCGQPKYYAGFINQFTYKQFTLSFSFYFNWGNSIYNKGRRDMDNFDSGAQTPWIDNVFGRWAFPGQVTSLSNTKGGNPVNNVRYSSQYIEDGSFLRLTNIRLSYELGKSLKSKLKINGLNLYVYGKNLLTWTNYSWFDPEISTGSLLEAGTDKGRYPKSREIGLGMNLSF